MATLQLLLEALGIEYCTLRTKGVRQCPESSQNFSLGRSYGTLIKLFVASGHPYVH